MNKYWIRRQITTQGPDPTIMVTWTYEHKGTKIVIEEFQNVYIVEIDGKQIDDELVTQKATEIHKQFEDEFLEAENAKEYNDARF